MKMMMMMNKERDYANNKKNPLFGSPVMLSKLVNSDNRSLQTRTNNKMFKILNSTVSVACPSGRAV